MKKKTCFLTTQKKFKKLHTPDRFNPDFEIVYVIGFKYSMWNVDV